MLGLLAGALLVVLLGGAVWIAWGLPDIDMERPPEGRLAITLEAADGTPITQSGGLYAGPVTRAELPDHLVEAVLAIEDRRFYDHIGVDAFGIVRAAWRNFMAGAIVQGGSTITQQLAKVLFLSPEQTLHRKLQEAVIATWLDTRYTKDEILAKYLDSVYFGAGATGISAAAKVYFDKEVSELTLPESAMLAGLVRAPSRLNPRSNLKAARERATLVLHAMVESKFITLDQALEAALNAAAPVRGAAVAQTGSWFGDWAYNEVKYAMGPLAGAARVRTTLQPKLQALAERVVAEGLSRAGPEAKIGQAALVALGMDGAVLAMVGGRSYADSQFNRATDAERQPGSAFKTFVYLAALQAGWTPDETIIDEPIEIGGWRPKNYSGRYAGEVTLEQAFARSLNAPTVKLAQEIGIGRVIDTAHALGIDAALEPNLTLSLGTAGVTLLDLTGAYASIAAGRQPLQPWGIAGLAAKSADQPTMFSGGERHTTRVESAEDMVRLLTAVVREGTGKRAALDGFAAGKTGTSQESRDAWFIGFTDRLVVGVWVGNDDNSPMNEVTGGELPAEIWRDFVARATGLAPRGGASDEDVVPEDPPVAEEGAGTDSEFAEVNAETEIAEDAEAGYAEEAPIEPDLGELDEESDAPPLDEMRAPGAPVAREATPASRAERRAVDRSTLAERRAAAERLAAERRAAAERGAAERRGEAQPRLEPQRRELDSRAERRRLLRERRAAERSRELERRVRPDGPSILLGGRGLPGQ